MFSYDFISKHDAFALCGYSETHLKKLRKQPGFIQGIHYYQRGDAYYFNKQLLQDLAINGEALDCESHLQAIKQYKKTRVAISGNRRAA